MQQHGNLKINNFAVSWLSKPSGPTSLMPFLPALSHQLLGRTLLIDRRHLPSVGSSILLVWVLTLVAHGRPAWLLVGFTATSTYLLVIGLQFWLATHRGHMPEPQDSEPAG